VRKLAFLACLAVIAHGDEAHACVCAAAGGALPADGAVDVPLNTQILVANGQMVVLRSSMGAQIPLQGPEILTNTSSLRFDRYTLLVPLEPGTEYRIQTSIDLLSTFTTGTATDDTVPATTGLSAASAWTADLDCNSDCAHGEDYVDVDLAVDVPPDVSYYEIAYSSGGTVVQTAGMLPEDLGNLRNLDAERCGLAPPQMDSDEWCIELTARDLAGNGTSATQCFTPERCGAVECDSPQYPPTCSAPGAGCSAAGAGPGSSLALIALLWLSRGRRAAGRGRRRRWSGWCWRAGRRR
jgi:hypothetical protein